MLQSAPITTTRHQDSKVHLPPALTLWRCAFFLICLVTQFLAGDSAGSAAAAAAAEAPPSPEQIAAAEGLVVQQADAVRQLKGLGLGNSHPEVQSQVQVSITVQLGGERARAMTGQ